jgi:hypothetical protein
MGLSTYTALKFWREAVRDFAWMKAIGNDFERFNLINRVVEQIGTQFYVVSQAFYMTPAVLAPDTTGKYLVSGGTWNATTGVLAGTFNQSLATADTGKLLTFRVGVSTYVSFITCKLSGSNLPSSNGTLDEVLIIPTALTTDGIYIGDLPIMRTGGQFKLELESTETNFLKAMALPEMRTFRPSVYKTTIGWCPNGDYVLLKRGESLTTYGTLVLRYPRVPLSVSGDTHKIDLPDGMVLNIGITKLKQLIQDRYAPDEMRKNMIDFAPQLISLMKTVYDTHGISRNDAQIVEQAKAVE